MLFNDRSHQRSHLIVRRNVGLTLILDCVEKKFSNCVAFGGSIKVYKFILYLSTGIFKSLLIAGKTRKKENKKEPPEKLVNIGLKR